MRNVAPWTLPNDSGFCDGNGLSVRALDIVEYRFGARRGILLEAFQDGDAFVLFRDTQQVESVHWHHLCKVPEQGEFAHKDIVTTIRDLFEKEKEWSVRNLLVEVKKTHPKVIRKVVYNTLGYLTRNGTIRHSSYGRYTA